MTPPRKLLAACITAASVVLLSGCPGDPDTVTTWVDYSYPAYDAVKARINSELRPGDDISIRVLNSGSMDLKPNTITITAVKDGNVMLITAGDSKFPQNTADTMVHQLDPNTDRVDRVLKLIDEIHDWQATHAPPPPAAAPAGPLHRSLDSGWWGYILSALMATAAVAGLIRYFERLQERRRQLAKRADDLMARIAAGEQPDIHGDYPPADMDGIET